MPSLTTACSISLGESWLALLAYGLATYLRPSFLMFSSIELKPNPPIMPEDCQSIPSSKMHFAFGFHDTRACPAIKSERRKKNLSFPFQIQEDAIPLSRARRFNHKCNQLSAVATLLFFNAFSNSIISGGEEHWQIVLHVLWNVNFVPESPKLISLSFPMK